MIDIYVINLDERDDRWNKIKNTFENYFNLIRVSAIKHKDGWIGCLLSHKKCIQIAKDNNMKYIIVMEDDCDIADDFLKRLSKIKEEIFDVKDDWDMFLGGGAKTSIKYIEKYDSNHNDIYKVIRSHCTYMICYNHTSYDFILNSDNSEPIDVLWHKKIKCIMSVPFMFYPYNNVSNISNIYADILRNIKENEKKLLNHIQQNLI